MPSDFAGLTASLYRKYRRDLPADQAAALAERLGLSPEDVVIDLGCGTGQLAIPLQQHCSAVLGIDPEPAMLTELHARGSSQTVCLLGTDRDLPTLKTVCRPVGAVVIGNALHWMDETGTFKAGISLLRPGGALSVVTQGPPMWLGSEPWQVAVRRTLESASGPVSDNCRTDLIALQERIAIAGALDLDVQVVSWQAEYLVDTQWIVGHLGSAMSADRWQAAAPELTATVKAFDGEPLIERVTTTALIARQRS